MEPLKPLALIMLLIAGTQARASRLDRFEHDIAEASLRFNVPGRWIRSVMKVESGGRMDIHGRPIVSRAGAMGLMQLMPATWRDMKERLGLGSDPFDPHENILAGAAYLRIMYEKFGYPGLFGAYNAGPGRYSQFLAGERPLPIETRNYLRNVAPSRGSRSRPRSPNLFALKRVDQCILESKPSEAQNDASLFATRGTPNLPASCSNRPTSAEPGGNLNRLGTSDAKHRISWYSAATRRCQLQSGGECQ